MRLYHGTAAELVPAIERDGLNIQAWVRGCYVTSSKRFARGFARTWARHFATVHGAGCAGAVITCDLERRRLVRDPLPITGVVPYAVPGGVTPNDITAVEIVEDVPYRRGWERVDEQLTRDRCPVCPPSGDVKREEALIERVLPFASSVSAASGLHGLHHWRTVAFLGAKLAARTGADAEIVRLFAILHDTRRAWDGYDPDHGRRAADLAGRLQGELFELEEERLATLTVALAEHADGRTIDDPTIGTCWDADRLDLWRVGQRPRPSMFSTDAGRALIEWAEVPT